MRCVSVVVTVVLSSERLNSRERKLKNGWIRRSDVHLGYGYHKLI